MYTEILIPTLVTVLATGLGALPFFFVKKISDKNILRGNVIAGGLMLTASFLLIYNGIEDSAILTFGGVLIGLLFILVTHEWLENKKEFSIANLSHASTVQALMIVGIMTVHSFAEGMGIGSAFGESSSFGLFVSLIIAIQNIPEGLAIALILIPLGVRPIVAMFWAIFSSVPQLIVAIPSFLFIETFTQLLPLGLGFAAGAMIWMVGSEILPEAIKRSEEHTDTVGTVLAVSITLMLILNAYLESFVK